MLLNEAVDDVYETKNNRKEEGQSRVGLPYLVTREAASFELSWRKEPPDLTRAMAEVGSCRFELGPLETQTGGIQPKPLEAKIATSRPS
jgi:hypothetical protein